MSTPECIARLGGAAEPGRFARFLGDSPSPSLWRKVMLDAANRPVVGALLSLAGSRFSGHAEGASPPPGELMFHSEDMLE